MCDTPDSMLTFGQETPHMPVEGIRNSTHVISIAIGEGGGGCERFPCALWM